MDEFGLKALDEAIEKFHSLPGVGKKTALRYVLHLLRKEPEVIASFGSVIQKLSTDIAYCSVCHNISEQEVCEICSNTKRETQTLCVVENIQDVLAIESTQHYFGRYHVLGGIISPIDGVGPADLNLESLFKRIEEEGIQELILALSTTMEGDTTNFYIYKKLSEYDINISVLSRGISVGSDLEYIDEVTLGRSLLQRIPYEETLKVKKRNG